MIKEYSELVRKASDINIRAKEKDRVVVSRYLRGEKYENSEKKLLVIGRAINGWSDGFIVDDAEALLDLWDKQEKGKCSYICDYRYSDKRKTKLSIEQARGLEWVKSYIQNGKSLSRTENTPFWSVVRLVTQAIHNNKLENGEWTKHIAWTNLAKLSPARGGNPNDKLWNEQLECARAILAIELEMLSPTHILVIARSNEKSEPQCDGWIGPFYEILENYKKKKNVKIAYMHRPEFRQRAPYLEEVYKWLGDEND